MAEIRAFRGYRYDLGKVGELSQVVAPPYDIIDSQLQNRLYERSPYNAIRLELTRDEPGDTDNNNRYSRAAQSWNDWQQKNIVQQDSLRCLYYYEQDFNWQGQICTRKGFLTRLKLEPFESGSVYPHEQTMSGPKEDRLKLYRATGANFSPLFGLYPDADQEVISPFQNYLHKHLPLVAKDDLGVVSRWWPIMDEKLITAVIGQMSSRPIFIADGHHRYETALRYQQELKANGQLTSDDHPANYTLIYLVGMSDPGLLVLPTHRLINGFAPWDVATLQKAVTPIFSITGQFAGKDQADTVWEIVARDESQSTLGIYCQIGDCWCILKLEDRQLINRLAADHSREWQELGVSILHRLVLEHLLPQSIPGNATCQYVHLVQEVVDALKQGSFVSAALVPPATLTHIEMIAGNREKMPPKSTYFYPKPLTGIVFNSLKTN